MKKLKSFSRYRLKRHTSLWQIQSHTRRSVPSPITEYSRPRICSQTLYCFLLNCHSYQPWGPYEVLESDNDEAWPQLHRYHRIYLTLQFRWNHNSNVHSSVAKRWPGHYLIILQSWSSVCMFSLLPCGKASRGRPHGPRALSEKYCCLCNLSGSCVRLGLTE